MNALNSDDEYIKKANQIIDEVYEKTKENDQFNKTMARFKIQNGKHAYQLSITPIEEQRDYIRILLENA